jgi:hypothetical protein
MFILQEPLATMGHWMGIMETVGTALQTRNIISHQLSTVKLGNPFHQPEGPPHITK